MNRTKTTARKPDPICLPTQPKAEVMKQITTTVPQSDYVLLRNDVIRNKTSLSDMLREALEPRLARLRQQAASRSV